jgi:large subunit ribosomal protein L15
MNLSNLTPNSGSVRSKKRIARGQGSGKGGTATRGHKGAKSRSGYKTKFGFEGGQMPLQRRVPKFGFTNPNRVSYKAINLDVLSKIAAKDKLTEITAQTLVEKGYASKTELIKVLGGGELATKLDVTVHSFSAAAKEAIEGKGGKATTL